MLAATLAIILLITHGHGALLDLTSNNRRAPVPGLPDWSQAGYEKGLKPLPDDSLVAKIIAASQLSSVYGVVANDGQDDTDGLQKAITDNPGSDGAFTLIQLPPGTIDLSHPIYLSSNYLILRGLATIPSWTIKGYMADQTMEIAGFAGTRKVYIDAQNSSWGASSGTDIWIGAPVRAYDYDSWQVQDKDYYQNEYMFQDWFTATGSGDDDLGHYIELDHDLEFHVYTNSVTGGSPQMQGETIYTKVMPIDDPVHHVGIENLYMTQPMPSLSVVNATDNYGNMAPAQAMHGVVFRYARDSWIRNIRTYMTGSHPIATEAARHIQIQDNYFDGSWNKGAGGNGYLRGSRVWDSLYYNNTLRNLRHFTFQWCAMRNVATMQNMTNDMNMHGGYEGHNLLELNYVSVPYSHRAGSCLNHCGGEGGSKENGTWAPIYWSVHNRIAFTPGSDQVEYQPYFARDGSLSTYVWQFGWDRNSPSGSRYQHLSNDGSDLLVDWENHEQDAFMAEPNVGVNGELTSQYTSLFFRDVSNATGITTFSSIAGYADCSGKVSPKVVGYYLGSAATRGCLPWSTDAIDTTTFTHVLYAYATLASSGTISLTTSQQAQVKNIVALKSTAPDLKVFIAVGGWGLGVDASPLVAIATSSSARTKFGTSALALLTSLGADGIDIEWTPCVGATCISATQFSTIASAVKTGIGSNFLSLSTPSPFWSLAGINTVTTNLAKIVEFISLITHQKSTFTDQDANDIDVIQTTVKQAQSAGMPPNLLLFGIPFYSRPLGSSTLQSTCLAQTDLAQGTYPYFAVDSILNDYTYDSDAYSELSADQATSVSWFTMSDGSQMSSDSPWSVSFRARLSQNLCMGGVSVFSLDQDSESSELTNAIYAPSGLVPTPDEIVSSMSIQALDSAGFLQDGAYDGLSAQLNNQYPFLDAQDIYRILLLGALQIQTQLSNRLRLFLTESELSVDKFGLYKTWEGKAANYQLANATGTAKQFWLCEGDGLTLSSCPGSIIEDAGIAGSPHLTRFDTVKWFLDDTDGFKQYLNESLGINTDDLVTHSQTELYSDESCAPPVPPNGPDPNTTGNGTQRFPISTHHSKRRNSVSPTLKKKTSEDSDPYDPPEGCRTLWTGLRLIDPDTFFPNPASIIQNFVTSTGQDSYKLVRGDTNLIPNNSVTQVTSLAHTLDADPLNLISLLHTTLTSISLANQTISDTLAYIQEVKHDESLQAAFDQAHARESVGKIVGNIALLLLGFVPGVVEVGEITDIIDGGVDTFATISKLMDVATLAKTLDKESDLIKLLGGGLRTEEEIAEAATATEDALSADVLATRGKLGSSISKVQETYMQCASSSLKNWVMDTTKLGSAIKIVSKRNFAAPVISLHQNFSVPSLSPFHTRARNTGNCVFQIQKAVELKRSSPIYRAFCEANNLPMEIPNVLPNPTSTKTMNFADCLPIFEGRCQCDHLVEPDEFTMYMKQKLSKADSGALCDAFASIGRNTKAELVGILNDPKNMAGLFGDNKSGGRFNPNAMKNQLMKSFNTEKSLEQAFKKYGLEGRNLMYDIADEHLVQYSAARSSVAADLDQAMHSMYSDIATKGTPAQLKIMGKLYTPDVRGNVRPVFANIIKANEAHSSGIIDALKSNLEPTDAETDPDDPPEDDNKTDDQKRSTAKRARSNSIACGTSASKKSKVG
ncbi:hypothetical protein B0H19DRAFT_1263865 [Mycena capillaripes]|nr:hypothetical protein B0H19DRAFT_1263865 [Mycena capillaripes]